MKEIWKHVENTNDLYMISNLGRVKLMRNVKRNHLIKGEWIQKAGIINIITPSEGYVSCSFSGDDKNITERKQIGIHRLVAIHFIPNPENKRTVNHKNGNKLDNRVSNLEWNTYIENSKHAIRTGLFKINGSRDVDLYTKLKNS